jgi:hypothetical protein
MLRRVALVRTVVSEECIASIISMLRLQVTAKVVPSSPIHVTLMVEAIRSSEQSRRQNYSNLNQNALLSKV